MLELQTPPRASIRQLLSIILPTAADFEGFCGDYFPDVTIRFAGGQNRTDRVNLLLEIAETAQILAALEKCNPRRYARYQRLLNSPATSTENPYRGLAAFQVDEADLFFGRDQLTEKLWQHLKSLYDRSGATRLLTILGPSGSGKSSVARAGLLAELNTSPIPGPRQLRSVVVKPGQHPLRTLALALHPPPIDPGAPDLGAQRKIIAELAQPNQRGEFDGLALWAANLPSVDASPLLILVDQFEELYTLCNDAQERDAFVGILLYAASDSDRHVSVVLTLRSDFVGETQRYHRSLNQLIAAQHELVPALSDAELVQVISEPARGSGRELDAATVELLLRDARSNEGALPLLQVALTRIWEGMRTGKEPGETLREVGGVGGALAGKAQEIYSALSEREQATARRALVRLVQLGEGTRDTRRRVPIPELCGSGETAEDVLSVLRKFATETARLVTLAGDGANDTAEVTHEALFDHWSKLRGWIDESRLDSRLQDRAAEAARLWDRDCRPPGRLWRPPDLDLLAAYDHRHPNDLSPLAADFLATSRRQYQRERRLMMAALSLAGSALIIAGGIYGWKERQHAAEVSYRLDAVQQLLMSSNVERGRQELFRGNSLAGLVWLQQAYQGQSRNSSLKYLLPDAVRFPSRMQAVLDKPIDTKGITRAAYSLQGDRIATSGESSLNNKIVRVWDSATGKQLATLRGHISNIYGVEFSPSGQQLVTSSRDKTARIWDAATGKPLGTLWGHEGDVNYAMFSPDGQRVVTASNDKTARIWNVAKSQIITVLVGHEDILNQATFSKDGKYIVTSSNDKTARLWDAMNGKLIFVFSDHDSMVKKAIFSPDGKYILTAHSNKLARLWASKTGQLAATLYGHTSAVTSVAFNPDGNLILTADLDNAARLWDVQGQELIAVLNGYAERENPVSPVFAGFSQDGHYIQILSTDGLRTVWDAHARPWHSVMRGHQEAILSSALSPDGRLLVTASEDKTARVWDVSTGKNLAILNGHKSKISKARFAQDGSSIITIGDDHSLMLWDTNTGQSLAMFISYNASDSVEDINSDAGRIILCTKNKKCQLWDVPNGRTLVNLSQDDRPIRLARFSPNGRYLITANQESTGLIWDTISGKMISRLIGHEATLNSAAFSPDGSKIATGSEDHTARLWEITSGHLHAVLAGHTGEMRTVSFSPDGQLLATGNEDRSARLWDVTTGKLRTVLQGHPDEVVSLTFSPDSKRLVTAPWPGAPRLWDTATGKLVRVLNAESDWADIATFGKEAIWLNGNQAPSTNRHIGFVTSVQFSSDSHRIVLWDRSNITELWDAYSGQPLRAIQEPDINNPISAIAFSPDCKNIYTQSKNAVRQWDISAKLPPTEELGRLIRCKIPLRWEQGGIIPSPLDFEACR